MLDLTTRASVRRAGGFIQTALVFANFRLGRALWDATMPRGSLAGSSYPSASVTGYHSHGEHQWFFTASRFRSLRHAESFQRALGLYIPGPSRTAIP